MTITPDSINGTFEIIGGVAVYVNCWQLYRDKEVKGVAWQLTIFYLVWSLWNLYYYPMLNQWISFAACWVITIGYVVWLGQVFYYKRKKNE